MNGKGIAIIGTGILSIGALIMVSIFTKASEEASIKVSNDVISKRSNGDVQVFKDYENASRQLDEYNNVICERASKLIADSQDITELNEKIQKKLNKDPEADVTVLKERIAEIKKGLINGEREKERETVTYFEQEVKRLSNEMSKIQSRERSEMKSADMRSYWLQELRNLGMTKKGLIAIGAIPVFGGLVLSAGWMIYILNVANELEKGAI